MDWISYQEAERQCAALARQVREHLGEELASSQFVAIPRGGLIVLGMLSYLLGLERSQLAAGEPAGAEVVVVVDDCSLRGARFAETLERLPGRRVVFAHLFSHPELRRAILAQEPRVEACVAAADLAERSDFRPREPEAFWNWWRGQLPGRSYWLGAVQPIAFAWSEPDQVVWNERVQRVEGAWHQMSPRRCLDARAALGMPQPESDPGPIDVPEHVYWKVDGGEVTLWHSREDRAFGLPGVAGSMWRALVAYGDLDAAAGYLAGQYEVSEAQIRGDLTAFASDLTSRGLLRAPALPGARAGMAGPAVPSGV